MFPRIAQLFSVSVCLTVASVSTYVRSDERPITGRPSLRFRDLDQVVLKFMDKVDCRAATLSVSREKCLIHSRGFGWMDEQRGTPTHPHATMRIASITKPITSAIVRSTIREELLSLDSKAFTIIGVGPPQKGNGSVDPRISQITVEQLLEHRGGWDNNLFPDPLFRTDDIRRELGIAGAVDPTKVVQYMLTKPLQFDPGEKCAYSNFGYCVLGRVIEGVTKRTYADCVEHYICVPLGISDIKVGHSEMDKRDHLEVTYPVESNTFSVDMLDSCGGLIASGRHCAVFSTATT